MTEKRDHLLDTEQEARRLQVAVQIPNEGPLTKQQRLDVVGAIEGHKLRWGLSDAVIVKAVPGISQAVLSNILNDNYPHSTLDDHLRSLNNWAEQDHRRRVAKPGKRPLTTTNVVKQITAAVEICRANGKMGMVMGPTGIGKTAVAEELAKTVVGAVYININQSNGSHTMLLGELCDTLKVGRRAKRKDLAGKSRWLRAVDQLKGSHRLIILDDADKLKESGLEMVREIQDATGVPILMIGVVDLWQRILRMTDADHGQLKSRFIVRIDLAKTNRRKGGRDPKPLFTVDEVRQICSPPKVRLVGHAADYLHRLVNQLGEGSFRRGLDLVSMAAAMARRRNNRSADEAVSVNEADLHAVAQRTDITGYDDDLLESWMADAEPAAKTA